MTIVEQLDRATRELATDHPINNRLALILVDNATELMLHRQCTDRLGLDSMASGLWKAHEAINEERTSGDHLQFSEDLKKDVMTSKQRLQAKGIFLDGKLKVLEGMGDITAKERRFIAIAHDYRNELYHVGLTHDEIMRPLAMQYFLLSCDLFTRLGNKGFFGPTFSSNDEYTDVAKRYFPVQDGRLLAFDVDKADLADKLRSALPAGVSDLPETLASSARKSIKSVTDEFGFLIRENPFSFDADKMLEVAQWQRDLSEALEREDVDGLWVDPNYRQGFSRVATELEAKWRQRHSSLPHERWMVRANAVERERDPLTALDLYQSLREGMSYLEESILSASTELDRWIQHQVDIARGK
ncbi:MAG: hypothetical protein OXC99_05040 [Chloroflexi bacterium]|nr:hypothetical protein [Chloroflexota bacterium]